MSEFDRHLAVLFHSLGLDRRGNGQAYRNHFCAGPGHSDYETCMALVEQGLMTRRQGNAITGGDDLFTVTTEGRRYAAENAQAPPKLTRGQKRYADFCAAEWFSGTFRDWLIAEGRRHG